ncbi:MAG: hypothetical protein WC899_07965 [bacterium]
MKRRVPTCLAASIFLLAAGAAFAGEKPGAQATGLLVVTATVENIDLSTREVTLKREDGTLETVKVGTEARNLARVNVGDKATMKYYRSLAIFATPPIGEPSVTKATNLERAPLGAMPSGRITNVVEVTATVEALDLSKRTVTIRGPKGNLNTLKADDQVKLDQISVGDQVVARYTEAVTISVEKP